jgi:hypothetical protein
MSTDDSTPTHLDKKDQPPMSDTPAKNKPDNRTLKPTEQTHEANIEAEETYQFPPSRISKEKVSKENAEYMQGKPFHRCGICTYYQSNHCKVVRGYISPEMGCKYFQEKYDPKRFNVITVRGMR